MSKTRRRSFTEDEFEDLVQGGKADIVDISAATNTLVWLGPWSAERFFVGTVFIPTGTGKGEFVIYRCDEDAFNLRFANRRDFEPETDRYMKWHTELCQSDLDNDVPVYTVGEKRKVDDYILRDMRVKEDGGNYRMNMRPQLRYMVLGVGDDGKLRIYRMSPTAAEALVGVTRTRKRNEGDEGDFKEFPYAVEFTYDKTKPAAKQYSCDFATESKKNWPRGFKSILESDPKRWPDPEPFCRPTSNLQLVRQTLIDGMEKAIGDDEEVLKILDAKSCEDFVDRFFNPEELPEDADTSFDTDALDKGDEWDPDDDAPRHEDDEKPRGRRSRERDDDDDEDEPEEEQQAEAEDDEEEPEEKPRRSKRQLGGKKSASKKNGGTRRRSSGDDDDDSGGKGKSRSKSRRRSRGSEDVPFDR